MNLQTLKLKKIRLRDTDATGVLYFTEQLRMALETLEDYFSLREMIEKEEFLMPIVHAEADYCAPLKVGDEIEISISCGKIGDSSFGLNYSFFDPKRQLVAGKAAFIHVIVSRATGKPMPIPHSVRALLQALPKLSDPA